MDSRSRNRTVTLTEASTPGRSFDARAWHFWCAVTLIAGAGTLLVVLGAVPARLLLSLAIMATPSVIGALGRFSKTGSILLLFLWAAAAAAGVCASGGLGGPLTVFCLAPVLAALVLEAPLWAGAALSFAAVILVALAAALHVSGAIPQASVGEGVSFAALLAAGAATAGAMMIAQPRSDLRRQARDATLLAFSALAEEAGALVLTLGADGRSEMILGRPMSALPQGGLRAGLVSAAIHEDHAKVQAAIDAARRTGSADVEFAPARAPQTRLVLTLRRAQGGILAAMIRQSPDPAAATPDVRPSEETAELTRRLDQARSAQADAETARAQAEESAAARARFLANMSHELRTPLNAIMGFSDMMRARMFGDLAPKYGEYAELIHESGGHLLDLINDVLDVSKLEAQRYTLREETFDVREPVNAALRLVRLQADDAGVKLRATLPKDPLPVHADRRAIKQIVLNLLSNALKFTPRGGFVVLTVQRSGSDLELIVADTGVGIAQDDLERLGKPFEQAGGAQDQARGTGLGLSLVNAFAGLHKGRLTLESRLGEGTAATVRLPVMAVSGVCEPGPQAGEGDGLPYPPLNGAPFGAAFRDLPKGIETDFDGTPASLMALVQEEQSPGGYRSLSLDLGSRS